MSDIEQGTPEWFEMRRGKITASRIVDIMPGVKGQYLASRKNYIAQLVCELLTGTVSESYESAAMRQGKEREPDARIAYEARTGAWVDTVSFIDHPTIKRFGGSPDGLVDIKGGLEIKCPEPAQHLDTIRYGDIKRDYIFQIQGNLMCAEREWWDFASWNPDFPEKYRLYIKRIVRDEKMIADIAYEVEKANAEIDQILKELSA